MASKFFLSMASLSFIPASPSQIVAHDKSSIQKNANFSQFPSWVSLKCTPPTIKIQKIQQGHVENLHLVSLSKQGKLQEAHDFLRAMDGSGVSASPHSYKYIFETCGKLKSLSYGRLIHNWMRTTVKNPPAFLQDCVLQMYFDCGSFEDAQKVFDEMPEKNLGSWVIIIDAYALKGLLVEAFKFFLDMQLSGVRPNSTIYIKLFRSLISPSCLEIGKQLHSHVIRTGWSTKDSIGTAISNMYVKCGWLEGSKLVSDRIAERNVVAWTELMVGYTQAKKPKDALELFAGMVREGTELDEYVFSIILKACSAFEDFKMGRQIHGFIVKLGMESEVSVGTPLVDFYVKCASFESAFRAFERIREPNDVSWSALITGYCQIGKFEESLNIFHSLRNKGAVLNSFIYTSIFQACSALADINMGIQAHADAIKRGLVGYLYGESAIVTMYSKFGRLDYACQAFESIDEPDAVAWTAIISGYAYHGNASEALRLFRKMLDYGLRPNAVTFIAVFTACSHSGLVQEAKQHLDSMRGEYGVDPTIDHYDCMIDVYSRAGLLQEALELIKTMPFEPDAMSWKCLLSGCWTHRNLELGKIAAENLLRQEPEDTAGYILLFNLYALSGKWEEAASVRRMMAKRNLRKELSCSWIAVKGEVHRFIVGDRHHPQTDKIYSKLREFNYFSGMDSGNALLTEEDVACSLPERKQQLLDHSERLAIAFGLISIPHNVPILVFKNLRACKDCHDFGKQVSLVTGREIIVRDSSRFHQFKSGNCSCNDYW